MESGNFERCFDMFHFPVNVFPGVPGRVTADPEASSPSGSRVRKRRYRWLVGCQKKSGNAPVLGEKGTNIM
jgi:hypothetical protein